MLIAPQSRSTYCMMEPMWMGIKFYQKSNLRLVQYHTYKTIHHLAIEIIPPVKYFIFSPGKKKVRKTRTSFRGLASMSPLFVWWRSSYRSRNRYFRGGLLNKEMGEIKSFAWINTFISLSDRSDGTQYSASVNVAKETNRNGSLAENGSPDNMCAYPPAVYHMITSEVVRMKLG